MSSITFSHPFFSKQNVEIFLGEQYDEAGEEIIEPPTENQLAELALTYQDFLKNVELYLQEIQKHAYLRYQKLYAHYYEDPKKSGSALHIDSASKHSEYIKNIMYLRVSYHNTLVFSIRYQLDTEHGLELKFTNGQLAKIGGISET